MNKINCIYCHKLCILDYYNICDSHINPVYFEVIGDKIVTITFDFFINNDKHQAIIRPFFKNLDQISIYSWNAHEVIFTSKLIPFISPENISKILPNIMLL